MNRHAQSSIVYILVLGALCATTLARSAEPQTVIASVTRFTEIRDYEVIADLQVERPAGSGGSDLEVRFSHEGKAHLVSLTKDPGGPRGGGCEIYRNDVGGWPQRFMGCGEPHYFGKLFIDGVRQRGISVVARYESGWLLMKMSDAAVGAKSKVWLEPEALYEPSPNSARYILYKDALLEKGPASDPDDAVSAWYHHEPRVLISREGGDRAQP